MFLLLIYLQIWGAFGALDFGIYCLLLFRGWTVDRRRRQSIAPLHERDAPLAACEGLGIYI